MNDMEKIVAALRIVESRSMRGFGLIIDNDPNRTVRIWVRNIVAKTGPAHWANGCLKTEL